ncbi:endo alpha-1,4 polygalactosaminidase [Streptomyces sp. Z26]|uniref:endo alpha-1,4 polygalactosaminidase n=1 Tax=Streptomyces TaxID=1883 RepID=UPI000EF150CC|nr:endo alpha-1,4 polygalactosaminidase [Streptomyces sp. Z26]RLL70763.1 hypothetical protein D7M15_24560 [Streptomyces sp. Z26]
MPASHALRRRRSWAAAALAASALVATGIVTNTQSSASAAEPALPEPGVGFDYQIGGPYDPPSGTEVVSRDRTATPASGLYNICYINAFQVQPGEDDDWPDDLLLRDADGEVVIDPDWDEALLDIGTPEKRERVAERVNAWTDGCADKGFDAIEPDNYDSYTRSQDLLSAEDAKAFAKLLSDHAHERGLAAAQKNTVELADSRDETGLDFAVAEECGQWKECGDYADAFDDHVVVVEYTDEGLNDACASHGDTLSIVRRDMDVTTPDSGAYVHRTC